MTAATGVAAVLCGAHTLHSLAGCGVPACVVDFGKCWGRKDLWTQIRVLVVDEVSG